MKSILLSIKPKWVMKILNGEKTIEIRKTMPKCDLPITVYIYCTKEKQYTKPLLFANTNVVSKDVMNRHNVRWANGKVVAKFTLRKVEEICQNYVIDLGSPYYYENEECLEEQACLDKLGIQDYLDMKDGYAWHIEDLVVFDRPKELKEFKHICPNIMCDECNYADLSVDKCLPICSNQLKRAPQSYCYVEVDE